MIDFWKKNTPFVASSYLFLLGIVGFLLIPFYLQDGMFSDGTTYAHISRNLAEGLGGWWSPPASRAHATDFFEQPPLVFWLQSFLFRIFGDSFYVERLYTAIFYGLTCLLIFRLWKKTNQEHKNYAWLAVFFFTLIPLVFWSFRNNMLENTLLFFDLWAIYYFYIYVNQKTRLIYVLAGSFLIFLSILAKGVVGLFPIGFFFLHYMVFKRQTFKAMTISTLQTIFILIALFGLMFFAFPKSYEFVAKYVDVQLLRSLRGERNPPEVQSRFFLLYRLSNELLVIIFVALFAFLYSFFNKKKVINPYKKLSLLFLAIGFSASVPLIITPRQHDYYLVPAFVYFAISVSFYILPNVVLLQKYFEQKITAIRLKKTFLAVTLLFFTSSMVFVYFMSKKKYSRDERILEDIHLMEKHLPEFTMLGLDHDYCAEYFIIAYLQRYGKFDIDCDAKIQYFLSSNKRNMEAEGYQTVSSLDLKYFKLWEKNNSKK